MNVTAKNSQIDTFQVLEGDVLFTPSSETKDDIGHSCVILENLPLTLYSYHLVRLRFNEKFKIDLNYKRFMFNNSEVLNQFTLKSKGVTRMTLSLDDFYSTKVIIPTLGDQKKIAQKFTDYLITIENLKTKIQSSRDLQKSLINQLF